MLSTLRPGDSKTRRKLLAPRVVLPDLTRFGGPADGGYDIDAALAVPRALEPRERRTAPGGALRVDAVGRDGARVGIVDRDPGNRSPDAGGLAGAQVGVRGIGDRQHLQSAAGRKNARLGRQEAIEAGRPPIFGLVDDAGVGIDRHRLVHEAAHRTERRGGRLAVSRDLEDVPVRPRVGVLAAGPQHGLLAGQPRSPRRRPAGAVDRGAGQADPRVNERAARRIELERRRAAAAVRVVERAVGERRAAAGLVVAQRDECGSRRRRMPPSRRVRRASRSRSPAGRRSSRTTGTGSRPAGAAAGGRSSRRRPAPAVHS